MPSRKQKCLVCLESWLVGGGGVCEPSWQGLLTELPMRRAGAAAAGQGSGGRTWSNMLFSNQLAGQGGAGTPTGSSESGWAPGLHLGGERAGQLR